jgi:proteasome lid subunit RPN8/RPN11
MISDELKLKIKKESNKYSPQECCGLLIIKDSILDLFPCQNNAYDKINEFSINPKDYLKASQNGKIVGIYHSHCIQENSFSELDKQISHKLNLKNIVYIEKKNEFEEYSPENYYSKYIDKNFVIGNSDCLSIIEDYYNEEFGIKIFHHERSHGWDLNYKNFIEEKLKNINLKNEFDQFIEKENCIKINSIESAKKHDIVIFKYLDNYPSHFGIYLANDYILHQPRDRKSLIEKMTNAEKRRIYCFARHKELC